MAKFSGAIGFVENIQVRPGIWDDVVTEKSATGDLLSSSSKWENGEHLNDDLNISNRISVVADPYYTRHFFAIKYVLWNSTRWEVSSVELRFPRLILSVGGVYNGATPKTPRKTV